MSDGNYNRNLLPYRNYQSGVRAGRATMRTQAMAHLEKMLSELPLGEAARADFLRRFHEGLK